MAADKKIQDKLFHSAAWNDEAGVKEALASGADLMTPTEAGMYPIHIAAEGGFRNLLPLLLPPGQAIDNVVDDSGNTPLMVAAAAGHMGACIDLVGLGSSPAKENYKQAQALHLAAEKSHLSVCQWLYESFPAVCTKSALSQSFHWAIAGRSLRCCEWLLSIGVAIEAADDSGSSPLMTAAKSGHPNLFSWLLGKGANIAAKDAQRRTVLHWAALGGHASIAALAINNGGDPNGIDANGQAPVHLAALKGCLEVAQILIAAGANLTVADGVGMTPIHAAAAGGAPDVVAALAYKNASLLKAVDGSGWTLLHSAAFAGKPQMCSWLLKERQFSSSAQDSDGATPLHLACEEGHLRVVEVLLRLGSQTGIRRNDGKTAIMLAALNLRHEICDALKKKGAKEQEFLGSEQGASLLHLAAADPNVEKLKFALSLGIPHLSVNSKDSEGNTVLHYACWTGPLAAADLAVKQGASVNTVNKHGLDAISLACLSGRADWNLFVALLIRAGATPQLPPTPSTASPLTQLHSRGNKEQVELILSFLKG